MNEHCLSSEPARSDVSLPVSPASSRPRRVPHAIACGLAVALTAGAAGLATTWTCERLVLLTDDRQASWVFALLAALAAVSGSVQAARVTVRRHPGVAWRLVGAALGMVVIGLAWHQVPRHGVMPAPMIDVGFAVFAGLLFFALGGLIPAWAAIEESRGAHPARTAWIPLLALVALGCGVVAGTVALDRLPGGQGLWIAAAAVFLLAAIVSRFARVKPALALADRAREPSAPEVTPGTDDTAHTEHTACAAKTTDRIVRHILCTILGLALGASLFLFARYGSLLLPAGAPAGAGITGVSLITVGLSALLTVGLLGWLPGRNGLAILALAAAAWFTAVTWSDLSQELTAAPLLATPPSGALLPAFQALALGLAPWGAALGAATGLGLMIVVHDRPAGPALGTAFAFWGLGAAVGAVVVGTSLSILSWQTGWIAPAALTLGVGLAMNTGSRLRGLRIPTGVLVMLFLGYFVFSSARVPGPLDTPTPASLSSTHGPAAWTEIVPAARLKGHEQARLDRRTTLGPATRSELGTTSLEAHVPILLHRTLHPGMKSPRVLILNETVGVVAGAAARHAGIELVVSWLNRALEKAFSAPLLSRAAREGRTIASRANANRWFLDTHPGRFHVIVDQHPGASVDGALDRRTAGYFQAVRQALQPAGLYCLWIPFDRLGSAEEVNHLASAFCAVFPTSHQVVTPGLLSLRPVLGWIGTADDAPIPWEGVLEHPATASHFDTSLCPELSTPSSLAAQLVAAAWPAWPAGSTHGPTQAPFHRYHGCFLDPTPSPEETLKAYESFLPAARLDPDPDPAEPSASASRSDMARTVREAARRILQVQRLEQRAALGDLPAAQARDAALTLARALLDQTGNLPAIWPFLDHVARWCRTDGLRDEALGTLRAGRAPGPGLGRRVPGTGVLRVRAIPELPDS